MLAGKKILLGVSGSIAAYKAALLTRLLVKAGAEVRVLLTASAAGFITPLTLATLSKNPVLGSFVKNDTGEWNNHVELGLWADALVVAPASANTLAKCANGHCDNLLTASYLSARCPVFFAPAMDLDMYRHPAVRANLERLRTFGNHIIPAENGELASGLSGEGRMAEPEHILNHLARFWQEPPAASGTAGLAFAGRRVLVTAGPTHEPLDPVRFIGNRSTGKMGFALAEAFAAQGAWVDLVTGPSALSARHPGIRVVRVEQAQEMYEAALQAFPSADVAVLAAAVADYRPAEVAPQKIKKNDDALEVRLVRTVDIAATLGTRKQPHQCLVGFALETENEEANAKAKLTRKNLDMIVLNSLNDKGAGFGHDTNRISVIQKDGPERRFELQSKTEAAEDIVRLVAAWLSARHAG